MWSVQKCTCILHAVLLTVTLVGAGYVDDGDTYTRKQLIEDIFKNYDSRIPPNLETDGPVNVTIQVFISSIDTISETNMDFAMGMFLRQSWYDKRLSLNRSDMEMLELDVTLIKNVWVPDLFMPAEKKATVHQVTVPNKLMHIYQDGKIQYSMRISSTLKCNFDLRKFPLDSQHCVIEMESYGYTRDTLAFTWHEKPIQIKDKMKIPQFTLHRIDPSQCDKRYYGVLYTCVKMDMHMERDKGYYLTQVYLPSFLIVFLSWVSFWLDIDAVPARISLGLLTVLTMTTQSSGVRSSLPKVSYVKAIDVWMAVCLVFVFLALVQFAYVNVLSRVEKRRKSSNIGKVAIGMMAQKVEESEQKKAAANNNPFSLMAKKSEGGETKKGFAGGVRGILKRRAEEVKQPACDNELSEHSETDTEACVGDEEAGSFETPRRKSLWKVPFDITKKKFDLSRIMSRDREKARNVDRMSRMLFPLVFLAFNIVYWFVYIFWIPTSDP